jgi:hypothetical protein
VGGAEAGGDAHAGGVRAPVRGHHGKPVQVDPIKPRLKAPGIKRLKLKCDNLRLNYAFKFNLRRYTMGFPVLSAGVTTLMSAIVLFFCQAGARP